MIERITQKISSKFRTFGGEIEDSCNPIDKAHEGKPPIFALGVDVSEVVKAVLEESGHADLLASSKLFREFSDEVLPQAGKLAISIGTINDALILSGKGIAKAEGLI